MKLCSRLAALLATSRLKSSNRRIKGRLRRRVTFSRLEWFFMFYWWVDISSAEAIPRQCSRATGRWTSVSKRPSTAMWIRALWIFCGKCWHWTQMTESEQRNAWSMNFWPWRKEVRRRCRYLQLRPAKTTIFEWSGYQPTHSFFSDLYIIVLPHLEYWSSIEQQIDDLIVIGFLVSLVFCLNYRDYKISFYKIELLCC